MVTVSERSGLKNEREGWAKGRAKRENIRVGVHEQDTLLFPQPVPGNMQNISRY
jgi:hypothetical protein